MTLTGLGYYRNTIVLVSPVDAEVILSHIDKNIWDEFLPARASRNSHTIAGLISDSEKGVDHLNIRNDVMAFARVVAAKSFEPPLAIALFGKWGSGKSFFMLKLKEQIERLSGKKSDGIYCHGIAHIRFNAWSYMDANLWASLVTKIFEELYLYISENSLPGQAKKDIEDKLASELSIAKEEIGLLENKKKSVEKQINSLESKRVKIGQELERKIGEVRNKTVWEAIKGVETEFKVKEKIISSLHENTTYIQSEEELKKIIPEKYWSNPEAAYTRIKSKYVFLKEFFRKGKFLNNLIWLIIIILIIIYIPLLVQLLTFNLSRTNFLIPQAALSVLIAGGAIWKRTENVYNQLQPVIASFWKIKMDFEQQVNEAVSKHEQEEKALKLEIEKANSEILIIDEQIQKAETVKLDIEFKIKNALATEALYSFIDKRSKSEDYKKHLGIISIIRKDFEILNGLFTEHNEEADKIADAADFKSKFKRPLERIILYIDDLDRCPEENVVQVLDAVNLLMAFPLFVVIVGVDSRWVKNALIKKHAMQFTGKMNEDDDTRANLEKIEPSNYLEKIFQIPFHLKDAKDTSVKEMIRELAQSKAQITNIQSKEDFDPDSSQTISRPANTVEADSTLTIIEKANATDKSDAEVLVKPEALVLSEQEINLMQDMSEVIGNNPRAIKRFVNIYRIIKAHEEFIYDPETANVELGVILFLIALPLGDYRKLLQSFEVFIQDENNSFKQLTLYLQPVHKIKGLDLLKHQLDVVISNKLSFSILQNTPVALFRKHNEFIRRFTFKQI